MATAERRTEAQRLRHRRNELVRRYEQLLERAAQFPNPVTRRHVEELAAEIAAVGRRLAELGLGDG